jgi:hypothetical protein
LIFVRFGSTISREDCITRARCDRRRELSPHLLPNALAGERKTTRGAPIAAAAALICLAPLAFAQAEPPANNFQDLRRQVGRCLEQTPLAAGSRVTILFAVRRDGSLFGRPRISYSHLEGDAEARRRFLDDAERALDSCLPVKITPAFGAAIAGRIFSVMLGRSKPEQPI